MPFFKRNFAALAALIAVLAFTSPAYAAEEDKPYYFSHYDVQMQVEENNTYHITEYISANFNEYRHGIIRLSLIHI